MRTPAFICSAVSDVGCRRELNEDACLSRPDLGLWVVADGMGGHEAGDHASQAITAALDFAHDHGSPRDLIERIEQTMSDVNAALLAKAESIGPEAVVASTVVGIVLAGNHFACFWAGDSRAYVVRQGVALQLTRDDSHVQMLIDAGELDEAQARRHPLSHVVTAAVGAGEGFELHLKHGRFGAGDRFLLCSDGLSNLVSPAEMGRIVGESAIGDAAQRLVDLARQRGAPDNVTAVVIGKPPPPAQPSDGWHDDEITMAAPPRKPEVP